MVRVLLKFSDKIVSQPITSQVILEQRVPINILSAHITQHGGEIIVDIPGDQSEKIIKVFREKGVEVVVRKLIDVESEKCLNCGACISLCPVTAIKFKEDLSIFFDEEKCIGLVCGLCIDACPVNVIRLVK
jgi:NAD-dependent dihydropyrimidine dehydrogenase PreA subunit